MKVVHVYFFFCLPLLGDGLLIKKAGQLNGILSSKGDAWVEVVEDNGLVARYLAPWEGGSPSRGGGFHLKSLEKIKELVVGNRVFLDWFWDGHLRVKKIKHIRPFKVTGVFNGILIKKGDKWIDVENEENLTPWRFYARWKGGLPEDGGEYHPKTLEFFDNFEIDDPVRFVWSYDYRPRIDRFIEQEEDDAFVPFYEGKSIPDSPSTPQPPPPVVNPFDHSPKPNPFDQVTPAVNPFDQLPETNPFDQLPDSGNPFDQATPNIGNPFESSSPNPINPFEEVNKPARTPIEANPFDNVSKEARVEANPFENMPLPGNPFDAIPKK
jgi:hypothetical protein